MVLAWGTDSASLESILGVHSLGTMPLSSDNSMYFSRSSSGLPLSGNTLAIALKILFGGNKLFVARLVTSEASEILNNIQVLWKEN